MQQRHNEILIFFPEFGSLMKSTSHERQDTPSGYEGHLNGDADDFDSDVDESGIVPGITCGDMVTSCKDLDVWEEHYCDLDQASRSGNFAKADKLCAILSNESKWDKRILYRSWSKMPDQKVRSWHGARLVYHNAYRVIDGIREAWVCMLMDFCHWDKAVKVCDTLIFDDKCMYLTGKAQMALNKLHALLESRRMQEAFSFFQEMLDGTPRMNEILRTIEKSHTYQWHYSLARIHFLHNELDKAQHHAEMACLELEKSRNEVYDEPLQSRMWVNMIRAWTNGLICVVSKSAEDVHKVLDLWERTVCDLDRKSVPNTVGLVEPSVFCRLKFVDFLLLAVRSFPELEINTYSDATKPANSNVISIGKTLLHKLRAITNELLHKTKLSVEATNARYNGQLDHAMIQLNYLSTSLEGLLNNWALVIDAGPIGNEGRFANHADDPNAVLALGEASGIRVRVLQAVKPIRIGDEITVHYGGNYWDVVAENKKTTICKKYQGGDNTSFAPNQERADRASKAGKKVVGEAASVRDNFYAFKHQYEFKFFDGVVCDLNGSGLPALVLLQSLGETGTCSEATNMEMSCRKKGLKVVDCPPTHAAYPGKMLVAEKLFNVGDRICIYAGILSRMPEAQLKLNESDYISTVCSMCSGAYGFELEDTEARDGMRFKKFQRDIPTLTPIPASGLFIPNAEPACDLSAIEDIRGIGYEATRRLVDALQDNSKRDLVSRVLRRLRKLPDKNWKQTAQAEIKRSIPALKENKPPPNDSPPAPKRIKTAAQPKEPSPDKGLDGKYWGGDSLGEPVTTATSPISIDSGDDEPTVVPAVNPSLPYHSIFSLSGTTQIPRYN